MVPPLLTALSPRDASGAARKGAKWRAARDCALSALAVLSLDEAIRSQIPTARAANGEPAARILFRFAVTDTAVRVTPRHAELQVPARSCPHSLLHHRAAHIHCRGAGARCPHQCLLGPRLCRAAPAARAGCRGCAAAAGGASGGGGGRQHQRRRQHGSDGGAAGDGAAVTLVHAGERTRAVCGGVLCAALPCFPRHACSLTDAALQEQPPVLRRLLVLVRACAPRLQAVCQHTVRVLAVALEVRVRARACVRRGAAACSAADCASPVPPPAWTAWRSRAAHKRLLLRCRWRPRSARRGERWRRWQPMPASVPLCA